MQLATIETSTLAIGCELSGPEDGRPVILLHGWPDDVRTWDRILPALHEARFKTVVPYLRGFGATRFRSSKTARSGQLSALGQDLLDLVDALELEHFAVVGHDWGARAAYIASCIAPQRVTHCVAISVGWGTNDPNQNLSFRQTQNYWYHWYLALDRGAEMVRNDRLNFTRYIWTIWNPNWRIPEEEFAITAASFENPDWPEVTLHSYRARWGYAANDPAYDTIEAKLGGKSDHLCSNPRDPRRWRSVQRSINFGRKRKVFRKRLSAHCSRWSRTLSAARSTRGGWQSNDQISNESRQMNGCGELLLRKGRPATGSTRN